MSQGNKKNQGSSKRPSESKFTRKVLGLDRPLTPKEKMKAKLKADEFYLRISKPPKGHAVSAKTHTKRQRAKRRVSAYTKHLK